MFTTGCSYTVIVFFEEQLFSEDKGKKHFTLWESFAQGIIQFVNCFAENS